MKGNDIRRAAAAAFLAIMYAVGVVGHADASTRPLMIALTPYVILGLGLIPFAWMLSRSETARRWRLLAWAVIMYLATFLIESAGVATGAVFGAYLYGPTLGPAAMGVPVVIGFNWLLVVLGALSLVDGLAERGLPGALRPAPAWLTAILTGGITVAFDWFLEPVAIELDYWRWAGGAVPVRNYAAWFVIAALAALGFRAAGLRAGSRMPAYYLAVQLVFFGSLSVLI